MVHVNDISIAYALKRGVAEITTQVSARLGNRFWTISDDHGVIEVFRTEAEAREVLERVKAKIL